eukprot:3276862-Heterocapsa_arctica.AAC.1
MEQVAHEVGPFNGPVGVPQGSGIRAPQEPQQFPGRARAYRRRARKPTAQFLGPANSPFIAEPGSQKERVHGRQAGGRLVCSDRYRQDRKA